MIWPLLDCCKSRGAGVQTVTTPNMEVNPSSFQHGAMKAGTSIYICTTATTTASATSNDQRWRRIQGGEGARLKSAMRDDPVPGEVGRIPEGRELVGPSQEHEKCQKESLGIPLTSTVHTPAGQPYLSHAPSSTPLPNAHL